MKNASETHGASKTHGSATTMDLVTSSDESEGEVSSLLILDLRSYAHVFSSVSTPIISSI